MNRRIFTALGLAAVTAFGVAAQSAMDAYTLTPTQLRGTARFVAMGGAFTSLGSDLSCMTQNPAGLGMYRYSDIGLSFDISFRSYKGLTNYGENSNSETRAYFDNIGYVGVIKLDSPMKYFQWGVSYNRLASFDRITRGYSRPTDTSLTNYIASYTNGVNSDYLLDGDGNDPYAPGSKIDWLSALAYNSYMINTDGANDRYTGLFKNGTDGDALFETRERGYVDEYNIDFAGNISDIVYWGLGVGITDLDYQSWSNYSESMANALVFNDENGQAALYNGNAGFNLYNYRHVKGSGANLKLGLIVRPIDELRIGFAVHTPTWLHLEHTGFGEVDFNYTPTDIDGNQTGATLTTDGSGPVDTPDYGYNSRLNTPWRFMVGASGTIANMAIISADYERVAYNDMKMKEENYDYFGGSYVDNTYANDDIKNYFKASNIFRIGLECRLTPGFSARVGYNWQSTAISDKGKNSSTTIYTSGTDPSYIFRDDSHSISLGIGYRYKGWYIDAAWQYTRTEGSYHAYTNYDGFRAPTSALKNTYNNIVVSTGLRF